MEEKLNNLTKNYRCDINSKNKIFNFTINQVKPFILISFELTNTGINPLTSKFDDIFCNIEGICKGCISFYEEHEKYISLYESLLTSKKIIICKRLVLNNPIANRKYDFYLNIYTLNHGRISQQPIKFQICIRENEEQKNFITFLKNKKWGFDYKNKSKKIILEYVQNLKNFEKYHLEEINVKKVNDKKEISRIDYEIKDNIKIRKYFYDEKAGKAIEKGENEENEDFDKIENYLDLSMNIVINKDDVNNIIKKIHNKFKKSKNLERERIEEIICCCIGDFDKISKMIKSMIV
jgi:hypothetical protein